MTRHKVIASKENPGEISKPNLSHPLDTAYSLMNLFFKFNSLMKWSYICELPRFQMKKILLLPIKKPFSKSAKLGLGISFLPYSKKRLNKKKDEDTLFI